MDPKNVNLDVRNKSYAIVYQYQKDTCFYMKMHADVYRILLHKKVTKNILLDIDIEIKWIFCLYN